MTVTISELPNGLKVATDHMASVETLSLGIWIRVGARHESAAQNGISHLLEHMAFKGTSTRSAFDIAREIEDVGGYLNAYTGREVTAYYARVLPEHAEITVNLLADILTDSVFDPEELDRERGVILQELGQALDTPDDIIFDHFQETAYPDQGVGRPVIGTEKVIKSLSQDDLFAFMKRNYDPHRMVICAAGKVEHDSFEKLVAKAFGGQENETETLPDKADYTGGDYREQRTSLEQVHLVMGLNGSSALSEEFYTASVLSMLFGGGMSSRLFQELREKRGLVYGVQSFLSSLSDSGMFAVYAGTGPEEVHDLLPVLIQSFRQLADGAGDDEIARAKAQLSASLMMARESTGTRCETLAQFALGLSGSITPGDVLAGINAVDSAAVRGYAEAMIQSPVTLAAIGPVEKITGARAVQAALRA